MKRRSARLARILLVCPRCGQKKSVTAIQTEHLILCPRCGAGMRERRDITKEALKTVGS